jgi:nucleoside-diphosphate-sugar epimerase
MKRACITGCCGFVGRHFTRYLLDAGWHVTGIDDLSTGLKIYEWAFKPKSKVHLEIHYCDLRDFVRVTPPDFDLIIHCAAVVGGRLKIEGDPLAVATDLAIDADFFRWVSRKPNPTQKIVYFSSSAVYPVSFQGQAKMRLSEHYVSFDDHAIGMPDQTYGWSKLSGELLARYAVKNYGLNVVIYRPFSGYGEDQDLAYPFPSIVKRVVDREDPIIIWGSGQQTRDFIHIDDVVEAVMATMHELKPGEVLNLGSGVGISFESLVLKTYDAVLGESNRFVKVASDITKPEGVFWRVADTTKLSLMYKPKVSLEEGIKRVVAHLTAAKS